MYKNLIRSMLTYGSESRTLNLNIAKQLASFQRKILTRIFGVTKIDNIWRKRCNRELESLFGDLNLVSSIRINRLRWTVQKGCRKYLQQITRWKKKTQR